MSLNKIAKLSCRVMSIYTLIRVVIYLQGILVMITNWNTQFMDNNYGMLLSFIIPSCILLVISISLWVFANRISEYMVGEEEQNDFKENILEEKLELVILNIVGLIILSIAIPDFVKSIIEISVFINRYKEIGSYYKDDINYIYNLSDILKHSIKIIIGLCLIIGSKGIRSFLEKFREI